MHILRLADVDLHCRQDGPVDGPPVVFANSLGTDFRLWDKVLPLLPPGLRLIRYDKRGHGLSSVPAAPYKMGTLVRDLEQLLDHLDIRDAVMVGLSIGGMIAQGLAAKRLDLVRAVVLSNTGAKIATREIWQDRIDTVLAQGVAPLADPTMARWFSPAFHETTEIAAWRQMLINTPAQGYAGCSAAIQGTDFFSSTAALRLPALGIAGSHDKSTPPDLVAETVGLIPGSRTEILRRSGHLPCVEEPEAYAALLTDFLAEIGHVPD